ncbi:Zinc finger NHR/GATA-type protein [Dioscorea alata]|uniref:Zinc finger NHR/GATA-type protein n=2 Tax=Dioscorea alata TaxID=55571 RepID=A0ACB7UB54_DIOAL|nr:Zinc finger NHR/GATA-type protein [Dioscorea alata]KAH7657484.1 Zinc finger NHR/GATA-type protein [Dioscorea alata]
MTPFFMPISNEEGDQDQSDDSVLINANTSPFPCDIFFNNLRQEGTNDYHDQQELSHHGLSYQSKTVEEGSLRFGEVGENPNERSDKWLFMKKMMSTEKIILKTSRTRRRRRTPQELEDQQLNQQNSNNAQIGFIRFCSDCNTTKTPLWRSGPQGPKSLCNACGIRQRKARRAMAAAAETAVSFINVGKLNEVGKLKGSDVDHSTVPFKKRCKFNNTENTQKNVCLDNVMMSLSKNSGFMNPPPPQDERDAAILLMSLSCNLVSS